MDEQLPQTVTEETNAFNKIRRWNETFSISSLSYLSSLFSISLERLLRCVPRPTTPSFASSRNKTPWNLERSLSNILKGANHKCEFNQVAE